ncbi:M64 family metallopeptidase [Hymenobacter negativus]|uniref:T9SS type A sorting domain-containing protein n=1 Tax=Hymenobacter negativus TaxID=2795026 RepID=A0ABS3QEK3_9BACT|nr:M64 family metallopeptidase [Hymenobacter negativus]MBO2009680.1 T9SS type A sorting domain-containing protein [Hymenobacter negativus]
MKNFLLLLSCALLLALPGRAQVFPVDTLIKNGPLNNRINLVFVGDGYQANQMSTYLADVNRAVSAIFQQPPFSQYQQYFNVFAIRVPSTQSGTKHPRTASDCTTVPNFGIANPTTYFNTTFDSGNIHRLIVTSGQSALGSVLAASFPQYTKAIVMVNSPEYGGSGGSIITMTANTSAPEVMIHEMGHTFGALADEYWAGQQYAAEKPNMTQPAVVTPLRWQSWVGLNGVGNYPFAATENPAWSRPHQNCKMRFLGVPFCSVCIETLIERTHAAARGLQGYTPTNTTISNPTQDITFRLDLLQPNPNTLKVTWKRDGVVFNRNTAVVRVGTTLLTGGPHIIRAEVVDTTALSKNVSHNTAHRYVVEWNVQNTVTGTRLDASTAEYKIETYPNPVTDVLNLSYTLSRATDVRLVVLDAAGRRVKTLTKARQAAGTYDYQLHTEELGLRQAGVYTLLVEIDGLPTTRQLVKQ